MMYCYYVIILLQFFTIYSQEEIYLKANRYYTQKDYDQAVQLYESIHNKGSAVFHNLGNCYWYLERYKDAYIAYTRALKDCAAIDYSILKEQKMQSYELWTGTKELSKSLYQKIMIVIEFFTLFQWQIIFLLIWIILLFALRFLSSGTKKSLVIGLLCLVIGVLFFVLYYAYHNSNPQAVITSQTKMFVAPRADVYASQEVISGQKVFIMDLRKDWTKVDMNGIIGWVQNSDYELL